MLSTDILKQIERPSRYLGNEVNAVAKDWNTASVRVALAFPDMYEIGMSHLGLSFLYSILNNNDYFLAERVFAPASDLEHLLVERKQPLTSLESDKPLEAFDIIGFSLQYELSYTNVINMLKLGNIPLCASQRDHNRPLVIGGGPCAFNPEPLAEFFDAFLVGDGEEAVIRIAETVKSWKESGGSKRELLSELITIRGIYVPSFFTVRYGRDDRIEAIEPDLPGYEHVDKSIVSDLNEIPPLLNPVVPFTKIVHDRLRYEISRGCTRGCRFCQAGMIYRPVRERTPETILESIKILLKNTGYLDASLLSLSTGDYSCLEFLMCTLMDELSPFNISISLPSLRAGSLSKEVMSQIKRVRKTGFTLAPEAGTDRLRSVINKGITEDEILGTAEKAYRLGWNLLKLYFMIGLPTETSEDVQAIVELSRKALKIGGRNKNVNVSFAQFIPKPHTPFQWHAQESLEDGVHKTEMLKQALRGPGLNPKWNKPAMSRIEGVLARGDRRTARLLLSAYDLGCRFDSWGDHFTYRLWRQAIDNSDPRLAEIALGSRGEREVLPWSHLRCGVSEDYLRREYTKAIHLLPTKDCRDTCHNCGVCDHKNVRMILRDPRKYEYVSPHSPENLQQESFFYRLHFSKTGSARYLGHLEMSYCFQRALKRANLPVCFSLGFHPMPKVSFADALPVGMESLDEVMTIELYEDMDPVQAAESLNRHLPRGLTVTSSHGIKKKGVKIESVRFMVSGNAFFNPEYAREFEESSSFEITIIGKKKNRLVDLKSLVSVLCHSDNSVEFTIDRGNGIYLKPWDVVQNVFRFDDADKERLSFVKAQAIYR